MQGRGGTAGLVLPPHNSLKDGRVAAYCEGLSGAWAAAEGHNADITGAFAPHRETIKKYKQFSPGLGQAAGCVLWKKRLGPLGRSPGETIPAWCPSGNPGRELGRSLTSEALVPRGAAFGESTGGLKGLTPTAPSPPTAIRFNHVGSWRHKPSSVLSLFCLPFGKSSQIA